MKNLVLFAVVLAVCTPVGAQRGIDPSGLQFQVNSVEPGDQVNPVVATDATGRFVVVWTGNETTGPDVSGSSIWARRFGADGKAIGDQFLVNSSTTGDQLSPAVTMGPTGAFIVTWCSLQSSGDSFYGILGQRYDADGLAVGEEFLVNSLTANVQESPAIALADTGEFIIVWQSIGSGGDDNDARSIQARIYEANGTASGDQFQVNTYIDGEQADPDVTALSGGGWIVAWYNVSGSSGSDDDGRSVQAQQISSTGSLIGAEFQVNSYTTSHQYEPSVSALPDGAFVIVWTSDGSDGTDTDYAVLGQRYDGDALPVGNEFQVNTTTLSYQCLPSVAAMNDGTFFVVWRSGEYSGGSPDGDDYAISGQAFASDGTPTGVEFLVNDVFTGRQNAPNVDAGPEGTYVSVWQSQSSPGDDTDLSIQARRFGPDGLIFSDGFESGNTEQWDTGAKKAGAETHPGINGAFR